MPLRNVSYFVPVTFLLPKQSKEKQFTDSNWTDKKKGGHLNRKFLSDLKNEVKIYFGCSEQM